MRRSGCLSVAEEMGLPFGAELELKGIVFLKLAKFASKSLNGEGSSGKGSREIFYNGRMRRTSRARPIEGIKTSQLL